MILDHQKV